MNWIQSGVVFLYEVISLTIEVLGMKKVTSFIVFCVQLLYSVISNMVYISLI